MKSRIAEISHNISTVTHYLMHMEPPATYKHNIKDCKHFCQNFNLTRWTYEQCCIVCAVQD